MTEQILKLLTSYKQRMVRTAETLKNKRHVIDLDEFFIQFTILEKAVKDLLNGE